MGRYCKICGRSRPNEAFGGKGQRRFICNRCRKLPKEQRNRTQWLDEMYGYLEQSNISAKNIERLRLLEKCEIEDVAQLAEFVRQVAEVKPHKKRRWLWLREKQPDLFEKAVELGVREKWLDDFADDEFDLLYDHGDFDEQPF